MTTLTVFKFPDAHGADQMLRTLEGLQKEHLITIVDAATVSWPADQKKPKTRLIYNLTGAGALSGAFWGMLFGMLFFVPFLGAAIGATIGSISGIFTDIGIDDSFIKEVQTKVTPGTSALFLMSSEVVLDKVTDAVRGQDFELIASNLSNEQEARLKEYFAES